MPPTGHLRHSKGFDGRPLVFGKFRMFSVKLVFGREGAETRQSAPELYKILRAFGNPQDLAGISP